MPASAASRWARSSAWELQRREHDPGLVCGQRLDRRDRVGDRGGEALDVVAGDEGTRQVDLGGAQLTGPPGFAELGPRRQPLRPSGEAAGFGERCAAAVADERGHVGVAVDLGPALAGVLGLRRGDLGVEAGDELTGLGDVVAVDSQIEGVDRLSQPLEPVAGAP